jgi:5-methylcytosine-specific restriction protein A
MCLKEGRYVAVEEVHHIKPLSQGGTHAESNLMSLCQSCHMKIHMELGDRQIRK